METISPAYLLAAAVAMDLVLGDPHRLPHPIRWMGHAIAVWEPVCRKHITGPFGSGLFFAASLILATWITAFGSLGILRLFHPVLGDVVEIVLVFYCLSARSLEKEAMTVYGHLKANRTEAARSRLRYIVGRDCDRLSEEGMSRATVETVAENLVDGFISPLFYAAIGGAPLALAYKMINTLDSMVGYKNDAYLIFGRPAARIDDVANYLPARLSVPVIALAAGLLSGRWRLAITTALHEGRQHSSPNAGYAEAAFAGVLAVRLGGPNIYHGKLVDKPYIGTRYGNTAPIHIRKACELMLVTSLVWTGLLCGACWISTLF